MDYVALREKPRQFLALSSLHVAEFDDLLPDFAPAWERCHRWTCWKVNAASLSPTASGLTPC
ncbi:MAG: hypothetical protein ACRYFR_18430 [Janthinobacterium lividum]